MALRRWRHSVAPPPIHHPGPWQGSKWWTTLRISIVWKFKLSQLKMEEQHHHPTHLASTHGGGHAPRWEMVVIGPGQTVLFYGRQSLGEGLSLGKVWDATFMLSGAISWVGKQAQLNANPVSLNEGWQLIAQAITEQALNPEDPDILTPFHLHHYHLASAIRASAHEGWDSQLPLNNWRCLGIAIGHCTMIEAEHYNVARNIAISDEIYGLPHPCCHCWIVGLRVTEAQCQLLHQCCLDLIGLEAPGIHTVFNAIGS